MPFATIGASVTPYWSFVFLSDLSIQPFAITVPSVILGIVNDFLRFSERIIGNFGTCTDFCIGYHLQISLSSSKVGCVPSGTKNSRPVSISF